MCVCACVRACVCACVRVCVRVYQRGRKAKQKSQLHPGQLFLFKEKEELPGWDSNPRHPCSLGKCSTTQLPGHACECARM